MELNETVKEPESVGSIVGLILRKTLEHNAELIRNNNELASEILSLRERLYILRQLLPKKTSEEETIPYDDEESSAGHALDPHPVISQLEREHIDPNALLSTRPYPQLE